MMKRKVIALVLSAGMILGSAPVQTWAEESTETDSVVSFAEEAPIEETSIGEEVSDEDKVQTTEDTKSAFIYEETHEGTEVVSDADIDASYAESMPDNDELMQGYIEQLFSTDSISLMGMNEIGPMILSGDSLIVYNYMADRIKEIARGDDDQAIIEIPVSLLVEKMSMTSDEMEQPWYVDDSNVVQGIDYSPLYAQIDADFALVMDCLLRDFPYEMYWYDKTGGFMYSSPRASASITRSGKNVYGDIHFKDDAHYTITMDVADAYKKADSQSVYRITE